MIQGIKVRTEFGAVTIDVGSCDQCGTVSAVELMVNWLVVSPKNPKKVIGSQVDGEGDRHFCGAACLAGFGLQLSGGRHNA